MTRFWWKRFVNHSTNRWRKKNASTCLQLRDWLSWIFSGLPLSHVVRIIDCYLVEGHKFVTRAGIAIIYIWAKSLKVLNDRSSEEHAANIAARYRIDHTRKCMANQQMNGLRQSKWNSPTPPSKCRYTTEWGYGSILFFSYKHGGCFTALTRLR